MQHINFLQSHTDKLKYSNKTLNIIYFLTLGLLRTHPLFIKY